jgi:parallel beta-helix repeat protein
MIKKVLVMGFIVLFLLVGIFPSLAINTFKENNILSHKGKTLYVGGSGPENYTKIRYAINDAYNGDTVFVYDDSSPYYENVLVGKSINLIGENMATTIIDGNYSGNIIRITKDDVTISGFTIQNSDTDGYGIGVETNINKNINILNNIIKSNGDGIKFYHSFYNTICNNYIINNKNSGIIFVDSRINEILNNQIISNDFHGIDLVFDSNSNVIKGNIINSNEYHGINLLYSNRNNILKNTIDLNKIGLDFFASKRNTAIGNIISNCSTGFNLYWSSDGNVIYHNGLFNNGKNAYQEDCSDSKWDNDYPSGGNFWDDYNGEDEDGDGIGDTPYIIRPDGDKDFYPLMEPFINTPPNTPTIEGPTRGKPGIEYNYTFASIDLDGDDVWYHLCWGDKEIIYIYGPYNSGEEITLPYSWTEKGNYIIYCWARDIYDEESDIATLKVTIPRNKPMVNSLVLWFLERFPLITRLLF